MTKSKMTHFDKKQASSGDPVITPPPKKTKASTPKPKKKRPKTRTPGA
jgi:hypothetical protein